ncbi:MAG: transposase [Acidovorax sp.]
MKSDQAAGRRSRRLHDRAFKAELVRQSLEPGASVSAIALRNGINANMLFKWRREHGRTTGELAAPTVLLPVAVVPQAEAAAVPAPFSGRKPAPCSSVIELEIADVQLRLRGAVDEASLCSVLRALHQAR